jgi:hypothetical protein
VRIGTSLGSRYTASGGGCAAPGASHRAFLDGPYYGFGLQAGLKYFPANPVSLDAGLGWSWQRVEEDAPSFAASPSKVTVTSTSLGLHLGVSVYLGGGR